MKIEKRVQDLIRIGNLPEDCRDVLQQSIEDLYHRKIEVIIRDNKIDANKSERNKFSWSQNSITICRWIYNFKTEEWIENGGLKFMWRFFHEIGHSLDTPITKTEPNLKRELFAWNKAKNILLKYFDKYGNLDHFEEIMQADLETYYLYEKSKKNPT